jgi:hypothetical protein
MTHRSLLVLSVAAVATLDVLTGTAQGQTPAPPPLTYERIAPSASSRRSAASPRRSKVC